MIAARGRPSFPAVPTLLVVGVVLALLRVGAALAQGGPLTPEQALARRQLEDLDAASESGRLAFTAVEPSKGERRDKHVWVMDVRTRGARQFTRSAKSEWAPRWSPDGRRLAFLSDRDGKARLWVMPADVGEAFRVAEPEAKGDGLEWSPDGTQIAYLAKEPKSEAEEKREKDKDDARVVDRDDKPPRLWLADVASKKARLLTPAPWKVAEAQWLPKGDRLAVIATDHPESDRWTDRVFLLTVADGTLTPIAEPAGPVGGLRVSPDGRSLAYLASRSGGPDPEDLFVLSLAPADGAPRNLTAESIDRGVTAYRWRRDGSLLALVESGVGSALYKVTADGKASAQSAPHVTVSDFTLFDLPAASGGGSVAGSAADDAGAGRAATETIAFVGERTTEAPEIWLWRPGKAPEPVTRLNDSWRTIALAAPEVIRYPSFDRTEIEGLLLRPEVTGAGRGAPLVVLAHGGPTGRWEDRFEAWGQLLAARGFAVFYPNVRGSTGYGHRFVEMNRGDWGGGDFKDLMSSVDLLVARGVADPERLGIGGWSYGGYMAMWAVTQTPRFKAAVAGAGLSNLASEYGTEDEPAYDEWFYGLPYERLDGFLKSSPIAFAKNVSTPTLILQGEADVVDPIGQSQEFYRALKRYGVPSDLVLYPREEHGFKEEKHLLDRLNRVVAWFEKYLK